MPVISVNLPDSLYDRLLEDLPDGETIVHYVIGSLEIRLDLDDARSARGAAMADLLAEVEEFAQDPLANEYRRECGRRWLRLLELVGRA
jgi:hypothetical protein